MAAVARGHCQLVPGMTRMPTNMVYRVSEASIHPRVEVGTA